jgi:Ca2+-binding EF-hand superfamily protein
MDMSLEDPSVDAEKAELRLLFKAIDVDSSGHISKEEFQEALHTSKKVQKFVNESQVLRVLVAREDFDTAFMKMDTDNSNEVTFDEFWRFCEVESDKRNIKALFKAIDKDGSKKITVDEFKWAWTHDQRVREFIRRSHILAPLIHQAEDGSEDFDGAFAAIDADEEGGKGHGQIDFHEFFKFCKRMAAKEHAERLIRIGKRQKQRENQRRKRMEQDRIRQHVFHTARPGPPAGSFTISIWPRTQPTAMATKLANGKTRR